MEQHKLEVLLDALETFDAELEGLEYDTEWFVSDSREKLKAAMYIVATELGVTSANEHDDEEIEQFALALHDE